MLPQDLIKSFLTENGIHPDSIDLNSELPSFMDEMQKGLNGSPSSMLMLPSYISHNYTLFPGDTSVAIDIGGTNLRIARLKVVSDSSIVIDSVSKYRMPGLDSIIDFSDFVASVVDILIPFLGKNTNVGICFSYPADILPNLDAKIITFDKEIKILNEKGKLLCASLKKELAKRGDYSHCQFKVINDTVAAMLAATVSHDITRFSGIAGFILGTGTNICYTEKTEHVRNMPNDSNYSEPSMAISTEFGGYNKIKRKRIDIEIDEESQIPHDMETEKMIAGAYLGEIARKTLLVASENNFLSDGCKKELSALDRISTQELNQYYMNPHKDSKLSHMAKSNMDAIFIRRTAEAIFDRAAKITSLCFAAIAIQTGAVKSLGKPLLISAEGTTFEKTGHYRLALSKWLHSFAEDEKNCLIHVVTVPDATIIGTGIAALK